MALIPSLSHPDALERSRAGGKGASLAALARAGFEVPEAFIIPVDTAAQLAGDPATWPQELRDELAEAFRSLAGEGAVAVRSSAVDEDGEAASFAGQHETVLNVATADDLLVAIRRCLDSVHREGAAAYRARAGSASVAMAVVVQRMVAAEAAGVAFSIDPVTGVPGRIVVEAVAGLGEGLVAGTVEGDRWVFARDGLRLIEERHPAVPALSKARAMGAAMAALGAEQHFGGPQDIEFAYDSDTTLWMLQSRPITAVAIGEAGPGEFDTPTSAEDYWTSANIGEVLPGLLTPLAITTFASYADRAYTSGYQKLRMLDKDESPRFVGFFHNRAFLHIDSTRLIADRAIGGNGDAIEHRFLGGELIEKPKTRHSRKLWKHRLFSAFPLLRMTRTIGKRGEEIERATLALEAKVRADDVAAMTDAAIETRRAELAEFVAGTFAVHLQASGCAGTGFDIVSRLVRGQLKEETEGRVPALFTGLPDVESARISVDLWELSRVARASGAAQELKGGADPLDPALPGPWRAALEAFLRAHGHRGLAEMEPAVPNWRQDPSQVAAIVVSYLELDGSHAPPAVLARQEAERVAFTEELAGRMNPVKRRLFRAFLSDAQGWVALRERTKSVIVRGTRLSDFYLPEAGRRLAERGIITDTADLFYLSVTELSAALTGDDTPLRDRVARRRREFGRNRYIQLPERFHGRPVELDPAANRSSRNTLEGTPVSPGTVTGRARVIRDPRTDGPMQPGEILVAPVTDAGWTPLFALATGLVVDMGSALSHGSTVAREYGLPAVVNVRTGTSTIKTGDLIAVDGSRGLVTILERATP